ncbi:hypothetical protein ACJX0J_032869 [Zea mays]
MCYFDQLAAKNDYAYLPYFILHVSRQIFTCVLKMIFSWKKCLPELGVGQEFVFESSFSTFSLFDMYLCVKCSFSWFLLLSFDLFNDIVYSISQSFFSSLFFLCISKWLSLVGLFRKINITPKLSGREVEHHHQRGITTRKEYFDIFSDCHKGTIMIAPRHILIATFFLTNGPGRYGMTIWAVWIQGQHDWGERYQGVLSYIVLEEDIYLTTDCMYMHQNEDSEV